MFLICRLRFHFRAAVLLVLAGWVLGLQACKPKAEATGSGKERGQEARVSHSESSANIVPQDSSGTGTSAPARLTVTRISVRMPIGTDGRVPADAMPEVKQRSIDLDLPQPVAAFDRWLSRYLGADPAKRNALLAEGSALAAARREAMADLIASRPESALLATPAPAARAALPPEISGQLEQVVAGQGFYGVKAICNHDEFAGHGPGCRIEQEALINGKIYKASIYGSRMNRLTEENASLYGVALDGRIALHEDDYVVLPAEEATSDPARAGQLALIHNGEMTFFSDQAALETHFKTSNQP
jgi:hypothetical protein